MTGFVKEIEGEFWQTSAEMALRSLAREYHERTEAFDQTYCRARNERGFAVPQGNEWAVCNAFALRQCAELSRHAAYLGFDHRAFEEAIRAEARHFERDWVAGRRHIVTPDPTTQEPSASSDASYALRACGTRHATL